MSFFKFMTLDTVGTDRKILNFRYGSYLLRKI